MGEGVVDEQAAPHVGPDPLGGCHEDARVGLGDSDPGGVDHRVEGFGQPH
jgi:hypothetical protein